MPWVRVDDGFLEHPKTTHAAKVLGRFGLGRVLVVWHQGLHYASRFLTDGMLTTDAVRRFHSDPQPLTVAAALVSAGLWEATEAGFHIHDYLDYNAPRDAVLRKREADRARKRGGVAQDSLRNTVGVATESARIPGGVAQDSSPRARARSRDPIPIPIPSTPDTPSGVSSVGARDKPLGYRPRIDVAWPGRPPVPGGLHAEFKDKLGGNPDAANTELRAWYPVVAAAYEGQPIGDDDWRFWRARFREWVGTTVQPTTGGGQEAAAIARKIGPSYAETGWFEECKETHGGTCENKLRHWTRRHIELAKAAEAATP